MCVYSWVFINLCTCVCVRACMTVHACPCMYVRPCVSVHVCSSMRVRGCVFVRVFSFTCVRSYRIMHVRLFVCPYMCVRPRLYARPCGADRFACSCLTVSVYPYVDGYWCWLRIKKMISYELLDNSWYSCNLTSSWHKLNLRNPKTDNHTYPHMPVRYVCIFLCEQVNKHRYAYKHRCAYLLPLPTDPVCIYIRVTEML